MSYKEIKTFSEDGNYHVIIETVKGSSNKYSWDEQNDLMKFKKPLPLGFIFPFDFGFIPGTLGEDGDPLDAVLFADYPMTTGCIVESILLGVMLCEQTEKKKTIRNDRFIFKPVETIQYKSVKRVEDIDKNIFQQLERFFEFYNKEEGKEFKLLEISGIDKATKLIKKAIHY